MPQGIPVEFALLTILAAFGAAFGILYRALTLITGKRKKRSLGDQEEDDEEGGGGAIVMFQDFLWKGKRYFLLRVCFNDDFGTLYVCTVQILKIQINKKNVNF